MALELLLPLVMLLFIAMAAVAALGMSRRKAQMAARLDEVVSSRAPIIPIVSFGPSIRIAPRRRSKLNRFARLLKIPNDLPLANVFPPSVIITISTGIALTIGWSGSFLVSWPLSLIDGLVMWLLVTRGLFGWEINRYRAKLIQQLPDTIQLVVSATRAGLPVSEAFRAIAQEMPSPTCDEFVRVEREMALGGTADEALLELHQRTGVSEYAIFAVTIGVQSRSGGRLAETVQNLADTVRERLMIAAKARAMAGEAKMSAIIMTILPILVGGLMAIINPKQMAPLVDDPRGVRLLVIAIGTLVGGALMMQRMIKGATSD